MNKVKITVFDDGNQKYKNYNNVWIVKDTSHNGGKLKLINLQNKEIEINSISSWKTQILT